MTKPTTCQRIILSVLIHGGWLTSGVPGQSSPRLWAADGRLWALVPRQTIQALLRRGWVDHDPALSRGTPTYSATAFGRGVIRSARP